MSSVALSNASPFSSEITTPPVRIAMSSNISFLLSPKPGALTAAIFNDPRKRFTTNVVNASESISSAIIKRGLPVSTAFSKIGSMSLRVDIFLS